MKITRLNPLTKQVIERDLDVTPQELHDWQQGKLIQHAMPRLTASEREFILTGLTDEDWEYLYGKDK